MSDNQRSEPKGRAYTGDTIVMGEQRNSMKEQRDPRRAPAPQVPRRARRPVWPVVRTALLAFVGLVLVGLLVLYLQVRSVASQIVMEDVRPGAPVASPLAGGVNVLVVGVDERPDHPEEGVRSDTLLVLHLDGAGRWASMLSIPRDTLVNVRDLGETKINVAYGQGYANAEALYGTGTTPQQGGMALAAETVEQFLDLREHGRRIDYTMQINFDGFAAIIDALGGLLVSFVGAVVLLAIVNLATRGRVR